MTVEKKYTQGNWTAHDNRGEHFTIIDDRQFIICTTNETSFVKNIEQANAQLISQSPAMAKDIEMDLLVHIDVVKQAIKDGDFDYANQTLELMRMNKKSVLTAAGIIELYLEHMKNS